MPSFPPRWRDSALQFVCAESCGLRLRPRSSTSRVVIARLPYVRFRYSLVTRDHPFDGFVDRLQSLGFPPPCYPSYGAPTLTPVGLSPTECASLSWTHGPAQRSLTLWPARSRSRQATLYIESSDRLRCLHCRFDCYRVERTSSRAGVAPAEVHRLSRRTFSPTTRFYRLRFAGFCLGIIVGTHRFYSPDIDGKVLRHFLASFHCDRLQGWTGGEVVFVAAQVTLDGNLV
jgi:hypothetical protein